MIDGKKDSSFLKGSDHMSLQYRVKLDTFEGPLDLLLHLIKQYEIDIYDVPLVEVIDQYTAYVETMQFLELDIASEYLVMAATLIALKSQMLLPKQETEDDDDEYIKDPQEELMQRLIKYRKYKEAAKNLKDKDHQQIYTRPTSLFQYADGEHKPIEKGSVSIYDMISAISKMLERKKWTGPLETKITRIEIPIEQRMEEILSLLDKTKEKVSFEHLFPYPSRSHIVVTFMAILELMKGNVINCQQEENFASIYIYKVDHEKSHDGG